MEQALERNEAGIPIRELGKTGLKVSIVGLGGGHFCRKHIDEVASVRLVQTAIDEGIPFMDTAWDYHEGESERRMGIALKGRRDKVVLMTKVCGRDRKTAEENLHGLVKPPGANRNIPYCADSSSISSVESESATTSTGEAEAVDEAISDFNASPLGEALLEELAVSLMG